jgi:malonyl-CoA O-methyltransferase
MIPHQKYKNVIDLGAGSGMLYKKISTTPISFDKFYAIDISSKMLDLHPSDSRVSKVLLDFKDIDKFLSKQTIDLAMSSSALQWSRDLGTIFATFFRYDIDIAFAIFTSDTFKTIQTITSKPSPICDKSEIFKAMHNYQKTLFTKVQKFRLYFDSTLEMFRYIKKSGVSGGEKTLSYKEIKSLIDTYPYDYLEFEVLFATSFNPQKEG